MTRISFNDNWSVSHLDDAQSKKPVCLPHDAMLSEQRTIAALSGTNSGWFEGFDYLYEKHFTAPQEWSNKTVTLEFEGVYRHAEVILNGEKVSFYPYGYGNFYVDITAYLNYGSENTIQVIARNADQPNSRWYTGAGIFRPVWLYVQPKSRIALNGVKVRSLSCEPPSVLVDVVTIGEGEGNIQILDGDTVLEERTFYSNGKADVSINLPNAELWSPDRPKLYTCRVTFGEDTCEERFGIRVVECDAQKGFRINGKRILLLGACIHHDNGILGAVAHPFAERRKIQLLKEAGYNAIRSAHNPCSKSILDACDELGVMVLDEYVDMWYIHKTQYDYACHFEQWWQRDLRSLVDKDFNHPSVVMYSIGNEVSETAQKKGIALCEEMRAYLHSLDNRPVTCGINIFFNFLSSMGFGVYSDEKAKQEAAKAEKQKGKPVKKKAVGSEFINNVAGLLGANFMKFGATLHGSDVKTRDAFAKLDVAGYNYGAFRYKKDLKKYPTRVILGSETFCNDAVAFYDLAKDNPALIGDFVWTGMDYLGEVGLGSWEYKEYAPDFDKGPGWIAAGAGTLDLIGTQTCQMAYTQVAFKLSPIRIGVIPVKFVDQKHSPAAWRMTNALESWSWDGCEGKKTTVEVYARGASVALLLNGECVGKKSLPANQQVKFSVTYQPGELTAVVYDETENETARTSLTSAGGETKLRLIPEQDVVGEQDLCYVKIRYTDDAGMVKPLARGDVKLTVEGGTLLAAGNACTYNERGYLTDITDTYYGEALAIIQPDGPGTITVRGESPYGTYETAVHCE